MYTLFVPTFREVSAIFPGSRRSNLDGFEGIIYEGRFIYVTGLGKAACAVTMCYYLSRRKDNSIPLLLGTAGAYRNADMRSGELAVITEDHLADEGWLSGGKLMTFASMYARFTVPEEWALPRCKANTVSLLPGTADLAEIYSKSTGAQLESMEGAAFGLAAARFGVKAVQVRAVSNRCGDAEHGTWDVEPACASLSEFARTLI